MLDKFALYYGMQGWPWSWRNTPFSSERIDCSDHVIRSGRLEIAKHTTKAIQQLKDTANKSELRAFLGRYDTVRRFVPNSSRIAI